MNQKLRRRIQKFKRKSTISCSVGKQVGVMIYFKGCGKCKGELFLEEDFYGSYLRCLQCGRITETQARETGVKVTRARRRKELVA